MKVLVLDKDEDVIGQLISHFEPVGFKVTVASARDAGQKSALEHPYDVIIMDPAPMRSGLDYVLNIRRSVRYYPYFVLVSEEASQNYMTQSGMNAFVKKPIDMVLLDQILYDAADLQKLIKRFGDDGEDFRSSGGIIAKSAFNQLFLSALDRSARYGETSFLMFIQLSNYNDIYHSEGPASADKAVAVMCKNLNALRRQSDIAGQTTSSEYCLLIQRPNDANEPVLAANRFAEQILSFGNAQSEGGQNFQVQVKLIEIPSGRTVLAHNIETPAQAA